MKNNLSNPKKILTLSLVLLLAGLVTTPELTAKHKHDKVTTKSGNIKTIGSTDELEATKAQAKANNKFIVIKFFSPSCSHCNKVAPAYSQLTTEADYNHATFTEINAPENRSIAQEFNITAYPTFVILNLSGAEVKRIRGANIAAIKTALTELK